MNIKFLWSVLFACMIMNGSTSVDLVVFSFDRPMQLYAFLESARIYLSGVGETIVIYRASDKEQYELGYAMVKEEFPHVRFMRQGSNPRQDFKPLTLQATFESSSEYIIFAVDDIVIKDSVDLAHCVQMMETTHAYGFYLRLGDHLDFCYSMNRPQQVPVLELVQDDVISWQFQSGEYDWGYPNTVDMTVYRKSEIEYFFRALDYTSPNTLESCWSCCAGSIMQRKGLCFRNSKMVNLPLNRVQDDFRNLSMEIDPSELQMKFLNGFKLDIHPLHRIQNRSAHMEYQPTFCPFKTKS